MNQTTTAAPTVEVTITERHVYVTPGTFKFFGRVVVTARWRTEPSQYDVTCMQTADSVGAAYWVHMADGEGVHGRIRDAVVAACEAFSAQVAA